MFASAAKYLFVGLISWLLTTTAVLSENATAKPRLPANIGCSWLILITVQAYGKLCFPEQVDEKVKEIDAAVTTLGRYIAREAGKDGGAFEKQKSDILKKMKSRKNQDSQFCSSEENDLQGRRNFSLVMHRAFRSFSPGELNNMVAELLAAPREKMTNECV